jgi:hypothetical protein
LRKKDASDLSVPLALFAPPEGGLHERRRIVHVNVTQHPTAAWTAQQMIDAFPDDTAPLGGARSRRDRW